jgi:hypothetical protein
VRYSGSRGGATIKAGPHDLLFGSEFGANGRYGFYSASRYRDSPGRQFRPHRGQNSYWLFRTAEQAQPEIKAQFAAVVDEIVRDFG